MNVLIVDDEPGYLRELRNLLEEVGHNVNCLVALSGFDFEGLCREHDLFVVDVMLRESVSGLSLAEHLLEHHPDKPLILISGFPYADLPITVRPGSGIYLAKPFGRRDFLEAIESAVPSGRLS